MAAVVARVRWTTPEPTAVDEELVITEDGRGVLVVRTSRRGDPAVGSWQVVAGPDDLAVLSGREIEVDLRRPSDDPVVAVADRVAAAADDPLAVLRFGANPLPDGQVALVAVGLGAAAAEVELDPDSLVVHFEQADGTEVGWQPLPPLVTGFVSATAGNLGGVRSLVKIADGEYGALTVTSPSTPDGATHVAIGFAGRLRDHAADEGDLRRFRVRTAPAPLP